MKLLIVGSRSILNYKLFKQWVYWYTVNHPDITGILSGGAKGVDTMARWFAEDYNIPLVEIVPDWDGLGKKAGMVRNCFLVDECNKAIVFWDGESSGTAHTLSLLKKQKKPFTLVTTYDMDIWGCKNVNDQPKQTTQ